MKAPNSASTAQMTTPARASSGPRTDAGAPSATAGRMRAILLLALLLADCGSDNRVADQGTIPECPLGVEAINGVRCDPRVDTVCDCSDRPGCYNARCLCYGYWETDLVRPICDGGARD